MAGEGPPSIALTGTTKAVDGGPAATHAVKGEAGAAYVNGFAGWY
jgi:hypothetical protein